MCTIDYADLCEVHAVITGILQEKRTAWNILLELNNNSADIASISKVLFSNNILKL